MNVLRTPDERFANLPGFPFEPRYDEIDGLRLHYLDEGRSHGPVVLLLHGEPTWSFLYRSMIPPLVAAGCRVIAPDFAGFGRSDKPADRATYTYQFHVDLMTALVDRLALRDITLFGQDWGGLIGLRVVAARPDVFARIAVGNTGLPDGDMPVNPAFFKWREYSQATPVFSAGRIVHKGTVNGISAEVQAGYDAPFPDERFLAGARAFPMLVPTTPDDPAVPANRSAWEVLRGWNKPLLTTFSDQDPIMAGGERIFQRRVPGAVGQPHVTITGAGHFLQEDRGEELARVLIDFVR